MQLIHTLLNEYICVPQGRSFKTKIISLLKTLEISTVVYISTH